MIGIIGAMEEEVAALQRQMEGVTKQVISGVTFWQGMLQGSKAVVAKCGIGKVFAAMCAQTMALTYQPDFILNTGVAGGLSPSLSVGDVALARSVVQYDMDTSACGDPVGMIPGLDFIHFPADDRMITALQKAAVSLSCGVEIGTIASGDRFVSDPAQKDAIRQEFNAIACEMEGGAIGHVCYVNKIPFGILRVISDSASGNGTMEYEEFMPMVAARSAAIVSLFCKEGLL